MDNKCIRCGKSCFGKQPLGFRICGEEALKATLTNIADWRCRLAG